MDYETLYNEALERAEAIYTGKYKPEIAVFAKKSLETIFPELEAYEDERRRKAIHIYLDWLDGRKDCAPRGEYSIRDMIAWLEKQGKKLRGKSILEVAKEEKIEDGNKVEPKFHEGDWITFYGGTPFKILKIEEESSGILDYLLVSQYGYDSFYNKKDVDENARLWTIQDAKPGDVLFHSDSASNGIFIFKEILQRGIIQEVVCHCDYDSEDGFCLGEKHTCCWTHSKILHPATKEQRDTLFAKMKEEGYEWDADKKELKLLITNGGDF